jgi:hypothetical protein
MMDTMGEPNLSLLLGLAARLSGVILLAAFLYSRWLLGRDRSLPADPPG